VPGLDRDTARDWIERWTSSRRRPAGREDRFTALIDAVEAGTGGRTRWCSTSAAVQVPRVRLLGRLPHATVIGIDADPVSLTLGQAAYSGVPGLRFVDLDLRVPGWSARLGLPRAADAAVSTTALHWLPDRICAPCTRAHHRAPPRRPAARRRPFPPRPERSPTLDRLDVALRQHEDLRRFPAGHGEAGPAGGSGRRRPGLAGHVAERKRRHVDSAPRHLLDPARHPVEALKAAGFAEVGTLWQRGDNRLLCGVLPGKPGSE